MSPRSKPTKAAKPAAPDAPATDETLRPLFRTMRESWFWRPLKGDNGYLGKRYDGVREAIMWASPVRDKYPDPLPVAFTKTDGQWAASYLPGLRGSVPATDPAMIEFMEALWAQRATYPDPLEPPEEQAARQKQRVDRQVTEGTDTYERIFARCKECDWEREVDHHLAAWELRREHWTEAHSEKAAG